MPRVSVPITEELAERLNKHFPWGTQAAVVRRCLELLCDRIEKEGVIVIELLISGKYNPIEGIKERGKLT